MDWMCWIRLQFLPPSKYVVIHGSRLRPGCMAESYWGSGLD